ncbi:hypothetical protein [Crossiella sp. NPDC003009]
MPDDTTDTRPRFTPDWPTCTEDAGRCTGRRIEDFDQCLAHLTADDLDTALTRFTPGADVDLRGTTLTPELLHRLLAGMSEGEDPAPRTPRLGHADFRHCFFSGAAPQHTDQATSNDHTTAIFKFNGVKVGGDAWFNRVKFGGRTMIGPLVASTLSMDGSSFAKRVMVEVETGTLSATDTRFEGGVELRVRYARIDVRRTFFGAPSSLAAHQHRSVLDTRLWWPGRSRSTRG